MADPSASGLQEAYERAQAVKRAHEGELMALANVLGVGIGLRMVKGEPTGEVAVVVMVHHKVAQEELELEARIPAELDGVPVDVQEVGQLRAQ